MKTIIYKGYELYNLTKGKKYKVLQENDKDYLIEGNSFYQWYRKELFEEMI